MTYHHVGHFLGIGVFGQHISHKAALIQDGHPVRQAFHLMHFVGDDDDGLAAIPHVPQDGKKLFRLLRGENGGGLVQDQNVRAPVEYLYDLHGLLLGDGHIIDFLVGVHVKAVGIANLPHLFGDLFHIQPPRLLQAQHNVFRRSEHVHQLEVLMDHTNAMVESILGGGNYHGLAVNADFSLVRVVDAGEHIHEGGFAAAVFAQQGQNLSPVDVQPDLVIGQHRTEGLGNVPHGDGGDFVIQKASTPSS